jgi:hypothetical protein
MHVSSEQSFSLNGISFGCVSSYIRFFDDVTFESYFVVLANFNLKEQLEGNRRPNTQIF